MAAGVSLRARARRCWLLCCLLGAAWQAAGSANAVSEPVLAQSRLDTAGVLYGILRYTSWPHQRDPLRLCISRSAPDAGEIKRQIPGSVHGRALAVLLIDEDARPAETCDAVFLDGWPAEALRESLRAAAGRPVLTIGRGAEFCTDGGMFCLQAQAGTTRFEVNLNAISLSGLRVHPQVLRLARPTPRGVS